jgi:hypothetical protein
MADTELVDRIMPLIIKRIDGKTLAQKTDAATLLQKIDAKTLAAKVLPYLDIKLIPLERMAPNTRVEVSELLSHSGKSTVPYAADEVLVDGGFLKDIPKVEKSARDYNVPNS